jgi:acyl carrier protein
MAQTITDIEPENLRLQPQRARAIRERLISRLAGLLKVPPEEIDTGESFANYGLGSYQAIELAGDLAEWLGCEVPETLVWDYPTIDAVAEYLAGVTAGPES